jgi:hypothetical protein
LSEVQCSGRESGLINCSSRINPDSCSHAEDANIICTGEMIAGREGREGES